MVFVTKNINMADDCIDAIESYIYPWDKDIIYTTFIEERLENTLILGESIVDVNSYITIQDMYSEFKEWFMGCFPSEKIPNRFIVQKEIEKRIGQILYKNSKYCWWGIRFRTLLTDLTITDPLMVI